MTDSPLVEIRLALEFKRKLKIMKVKPIANEEGNFTFIDQQGNPDKPIEVWYYQPPNLSQEAPIVFTTGKRK
ncbi:hypothetical protein [Nostoc sp.]|uniref:hypothetical protein n=1 Tax=Nostoc sp. TaxID=1180 RepID=UPI002FF6EDB1